MSETASQRLDRTLGGLKDIVRVSAEESKNNAVDIANLKGKVNLLIGINLVMAGSLIALAVQ